MKKGRSWSWNKGQHYIRRNVPMWTYNAKDGGVLGKETIATLPECVEAYVHGENIVGVEFVTYTREKSDWWICKLFGHRYGQEYDICELNETGAYTAKRKCARCGMIEDLGLCLRAGGSVAL
jgi:hypothetical protein